MTFYSQNVNDRVPNTILLTAQVAFMVFQNPFFRKYDTLCSLQFPKWTIHNTLFIPMIHNKIRKLRTSIFILRFNRTIIQP